MIGATLSHFEINAKLGEGGMGDVYRAEEAELGRESAIEAATGHPSMSRGSSARRKCRQR